MQQEVPRDPPFWVAWHQALASIRVRFLRHAITSLGIALGIAFFASIQTLQSIERASGNADAMAAQRMTWLLWTSLVMCLVGVTNSMLMSVSERYREIGTIKCLGASDSFIVKVFFLEAVLLGLIGSFVGAAVGILLMSLFGMFYGNAPGSGTMLSILGVSTGLGVLMTVMAAIAPAILAARMPAAAALRVEV